ncbi:MAG: ABC transporter ATP-binding protein [Actinomycetaceae bacterium]|nr:ABC transporter ATP-binding protein [Actinomycetaceae bacterium]MDY6082282.1 ABC transporter ATP-binding protein [Actinomycetaceae bacterium]
MDTPEQRSLKTSLHLSAPPKSATPAQQVSNNPTTDSHPLAQLVDVTATVTLGNGDNLVTVDHASLTIERGQSYAIVGKSGSGKTSLVSILGLLNSTYQGKYFYDGTNVQTLTDREQSLLRARHVGFVFQNYSLIEHLRVAENVELALAYQHSKMPRRTRRERAREALKAVGLDHKASEVPSRLSGGEQQRVALARALAGKPELLICDEPTGALDRATGSHVLTLLHQRVKESHAALVLVTHDPDIAATCTYMYQMDSGKVASQGHDH